MNEEIDETEFYHQDFTTASEWEIFIARIEEIITQWKVEDQKTDDTSTDESPGAPWTIKSEPLAFIDFQFTLSLHRKVTNQNSAPNNEEVEQKKNPFDNSQDFPLFNPKNETEHSCLSDWYGIDEFIVLSPTGNIGITNESRIKVLLSSIYVAAGNSKCQIPLFVQIREKWQHCYLGVYESEEIRTNLEMVHLKQGPRLCQYLSGVLDLFKSKIETNLTHVSILVSMQLTFNLTEFGNYVWKQHYLNTENDNFEFTHLPFGVTVDPIEMVVLKTSWEQLDHRTARESEVYTFFDPLAALRWSCLVTTNDQPVCLLGEALTEVSLLLNNTSTVQEVLGDIVATVSQEMNPLDVLTEPKVPTISTLLSRATRNSISKGRKGTAPLSEEILVPILYFLFPDADEDGANPYRDPQSQTDSVEDSLNLDQECRGFKTCPQDSLVWRLAIVLAHALQSLGGIRAFAFLWYEFVQEMRYRWENSISIPGLLAGYPDLRTCLLHQKLQMLNCCIERKRAREHGHRSGTSVGSQDESTSEEDDEFFDCHEEEKKEKYSLWNQPVGRLGKFNDLKLISTGDSLYIPITQEPVPKSEDQLEEDTDVLLKLGSDAQGSELRAKMMSASLLSDMESFKAANPGSILEDFIRWYSPRDWIENENDELDEWGQKCGELSPRMKIEDNFWVQTWSSAKPVPAHRQKRLFDDTREAEKVLHYLTSRSLAQICELFIPVMSHCALYRLWQELRQTTIEIPDYNEKIQFFKRNIERLSRDIKLQPERFECLIQEMTLLELQISQVNSLMYKFNPSGGVDETLSDLVRDLIEGREIDLIDKDESMIGKRILAMFNEAQKNLSLIVDEIVDVQKNGSLPAPNAKEIILRVTVPRPATYSALCPQFMRAIINKNEFRLVGAFSEDIVFF